MFGVQRQTGNGVSQALNDSLQMVRNHNMAVITETPHRPVMKRQGTTDSESSLSYLRLNVHPLYYRMLITASTN